jgi:hypothetical protein
VLWLASLAIVATIVVGGAVLIGDTGTPPSEHLSGSPPVVYRAPATRPLRSTERQRLLAMSLRFVSSAVTRKNVDLAYDLASPNLRQGLTRTQWHTGNIPVVPFPSVSLLSWQLDWSYKDDVAFDLALRAERRSDTVGKTFTIELKRYGKQWFVEQWTPNGISGPGNVRSIKKALASVPPTRAPLGAAWLLVPIAIFSLLLLLPLGLALRSWRVGRRAVRAYEAQARGQRF